MPNIPLEVPGKLRELAAWYRDYSEPANTTWVCEGRLRTARGTRPPRGAAGGKLRSGVKPSGGR